VYRLFVVFTRVAHEPAHNNVRGLLPKKKLGHPDLPYSCACVVNVYVGVLPSCLILQ
jgi:hypothetical protein